MGVKMKPRAKPAKATDKARAAFAEAAQAVSRAWAFVYLYWCCGATVGDAWRMVTR